MYFNFRPIWIITSFSKVLEKSAYIQLYEHSTKNNILAEEQFGFKYKSAKNKPIYELTNYILKHYVIKLLVLGLCVFCDLGTAFNCVSHKILRSKFEFCVVKGKENLWFKSYFSERYQKCFIYTKPAQSKFYFMISYQLLSKLCLTWWWPYKAKTIVI
jgi:hypothetical protein